MTELPVGWADCRLSDICELNPALDRCPFPPDGDVHFVPMPAVEAASGRIDVSRLRPYSDVKKGYTAFVAGDVLFAKITPCMENGKMAVVPELPASVAFGSTEFHVLRCRDGIAPHYVYNFVSSLAFRHEAEHQMTGAVGQKRVPTAFLSDHAFPLPPAREQLRIVAKIEALFSELDKAVESLTLARAQLKTYRQALLKAAFEGRLTADWRAANPDKLEPPETLLARIRAERNSRAVDLKQSALTELPEGWAWATVQEAGDVQLGRQRAPQHHTGEHIRPYLRVANVLEDALDLRDVKEMNFTPDEFQTFALRDGDVLLNEGQAPELIGRPTIYRDQIPGCCFQKTLLRFRPGCAVNSEFALIVFRHYMRSGRFKKEARITTNIGHLTQVRFVVMEFPVPTRAEQDEIVRRFRELEALGLEAEINAGLARVVALRQSILKQAFSGRLVPQDPADEPAAALLARLRDAPPPARTRRRKTA